MLVVLVVIVVFMFVGCEKSDEMVLLYQNVDDCFVVNSGKVVECIMVYINVVKEVECIVLKYVICEDCVVEFGEGQCQQMLVQVGVVLENQVQV